MGIGSGSELHSYFRQYERLSLAVDRLEQCRTIIRQMHDGDDISSACDTAQIAQLIDQELAKARQALWDHFANVVWRANQLEQRRWDDGYFYQAVQTGDFEQPPHRLRGPRAPRPAT